MNKFLRLNFAPSLFLHGVCCEENVVKLVIFFKICYNIAECYSYLGVKTVKKV
ncbi:hypothetical protein [Streptococcus sp. E24BD]|uniref:hypothetical protein n=1 Tax=Streptococcus sp. E24BD TaxID=3278715 RepID=UPI00359E66D2